MVTLKDIKLIIWDLDDTFWEGIISEGDIVPKETVVQFLRDTSDMGIVHSICSKNDFNIVKDKLTSLGLWDYFVFPSIDWSSKGSRVENIISTMKLRPVNVLFIDDNVQNLEEVKHFCKAINVLLPNEMDILISEAARAEHNDLEHKRLRQYHQMEEKESLRSQYSSNEEFLMSCDIRVTIFSDCESELDRLHELIMRSNQLNFTKNRQSKEDLLNLIHEKDVQCGYVKVADRFGDYGIVGFYAIRNNKAIHYVFSCRTLGMHVEQYVYSQLGYPIIDVVGDVVVELNLKDMPTWINQSKKSEQVINTVDRAKCKVLFKGPCDMSQMYAFFNADNATTEFSYTNDCGILIEGHNHTSQIVTALNVDDKRKKEILSDVSFFDKGMLDTSMKNEKFDYIVLSMLTDGNLAVYKRKASGDCLAICEKKYNLSDPSNFDKYIRKQIFVSGIDFTKDDLENFSSKYEYIDNKNGELTVQNLDSILKFIGDQTKLILLLGSEHEFTKTCPESFRNRHIEHKNMNNAIRAWAVDKPNVILMPYDKYITNSSDFIDTINHFTKRVYYELAVDLMEVFNSNRNVGIKVKGKSFMVFSTIVQKLRVLKSAIWKLFGR